jgi:hypothetical protein
MPAIASARPAARYALFAPEGQAAAATMAGSDVDVDFVYEHVESQSSDG